MRRNLKNYCCRCGVFWVVAGFVLLGLAVFGWQRSAERVSNLPLPIVEEEQSTASDSADTEAREWRNYHEVPFLSDKDIFNWKQRLIYFYPEDSEDAELRSVNFDGSGERRHQVECDGYEVTVKDDAKFIARSANGEEINFVRAEVDERSRVQGKIYFYNLRTGKCRRVDELSGGDLSIAPVGSKFAFSFYGLHVYDFKLGKSVDYARLEGSAHHPKFNITPWLWNQKGTAGYVGVASFITSSVHEGDLSDPYPAFLGKVDLSKVASLELLSDDDCVQEMVAEPCRERDMRQTELNVQKIMDLPGYVPKSDLPKEITGGYEQDFPDDPTVFAVSADEDRVAFEKNGNVVVATVGSNEEPKVVWERDQGKCDKGYGHVDSMLWLPSNKLVFHTELCYPSPQLGDIWVSDNGGQAKHIALGADLTADLAGRRIVYSFGYYGDYCFGGKSMPSGYESTGHQWNGIAVYDLFTGKETKFCGQDAPYGKFVRWFW